MTRGSSLVAVDEEAPLGRGRYDRCVAVTELQLTLSLSLTTDLSVNTFCLAFCRSRSHPKGHPIMDDPWPKPGFWGATSQLQLSQGGIAEPLCLLAGRLLFLPFYVVMAHGSWSLPRSDYSTADWFPVGSACRVQSC